MTGLVTFLIIANLYIGFVIGRMFPKGIPAFPDFLAADDCTTVLRTDATSRTPVAAVYAAIAQTSMTDDIPISLKPAACSLEHSLDSLRRDTPDKRRRSDHNPATVRSTSNTG
jgi:hypothetical protein